MRHHHKKEQLQRLQSFPRPIYDDPTELLSSAPVGLNRRSVLRVLSLKLILRLNGFYKEYF